MNQTHSKFRRTLLKRAAISMALAAMALPPVAALAQAAWPSRPIKLICGYPAGSSPDLQARLLAEPLSKALGQPVVVENKPGAGGNIGADLISKGDDHTIGIIGNGNVGSALERGLKRAGHEVRSAGKDAEAIQRTASWAEVVFLAVPFGAVNEVVGTLGETIDGKVLVDVTNALTPEMQLAIGFTTSGAEELQKKTPRSKVVKAMTSWLRVRSSSLQRSRLKAARVFIR